MNTPKKREILILQLSEIAVDHKWNARAGNWKESAANEESGEGGFTGLIGSIKARGQDEPVIVRPNPDPKAKQKYSLVAGFRRFEAITAIALEEGNKSPTILAECVEMNDVEARARNIRENTARDDFSVPDLAWSIAELGKGGATDLAIAAEIGKSQGYVSMLHRVIKKVKGTIVDHWRNQPKALQLDVRKMRKVSETEEKDQQATYKELLEDLVASAKELSEDEKDTKKIQGYKDRAEKLGAIFGRLNAHGFLDCDAISFADCLDDIIKVPTDMTKKNRSSIASAMERGYKAGVEQVNKEDEEENEDDAEAAE